MNIVHLVVVKTLSTLWNLEEPFIKISSFQSYFGDQNLVKIGTQHHYRNSKLHDRAEIEQNSENKSY